MLLPTGKNLHTRSQVIFIKYCFLFHAFSKGVNIYCLKPYMNWFVGVGVKELLRFVESRIDEQFRRYLLILILKRLTRSVHSLVRIHIHAYIYIRKR